MQNKKNVSSISVAKSRDQDLVGLQATALEATANAVVLTNQAGMVIWVNSAFERLTGYTHAEIVGQSTRVLKSGRNSRAIYEDMWRTILGGRVWRGELINRRKDGSLYSEEMTVTPVQDGKGRITHYIAIKLDISERAQAEANLHSLTERLSLATGIAKVGVWDWDLASNMFIWDATLFEIYGFSPVVPMPYEQWSAAVYPEDLPSVEAILRKLIDEKGYGSMEFRITLADGTVRNVSAMGRVVLDTNSNVIRVIGVSTDVTERKIAEEALEQSRIAQMRFKDEFLSHVSHELRSPLTAIKQFTSILLAGSAGHLNKDQHDYQQIVMKNIRQLQSMIDDILEVTRLEAGKLSLELESVSVSNAVTDALNTLQITAGAKGVALSCNLPPDLPSVYADQTRLRQILLILLDNAIKSTPEGGAVNIHAQLLLQHPQCLLLRVSDTGCGISPEIIERIFERLYQVPEPTQASRKGLGLGSYICKQLVTLQGGRIWVESRLQKGSTFSFKLPVFSISNLIAPLLKNETWPAKSVALVMVEIRLLKALPSKESREKWIQEVLGLVQSCLMPNLDVLLPKMSSSGAGESLFVAAFADDKGASILADRILGQFERLPHLKQTGLTLSVSHNMLEPIPPGAGSPVEAIVTSMAAILEESIKSKISSEAICYE